MHKEALAEISATLEWLKYSAGPKGHDIYEAYENQILIPGLMRLRAAVDRSGLYSVLGVSGAPNLPPAVLKATMATDAKIAQHNAEKAAKQPRPVRFYNH